MAVILPGAGDYESALRMMGEANAIDAFAEGRERNIRMQGELQRQALQRQAAEQRQDEINRKQALESAGFTEEMLASALSGGGGATGGGGRRRASSAGPALDYEAASLQEALAADAAEAQAASTQRMRELDAAQMALAKQLPAQAALEREVEAGAARQRLLSGTPSYTASRMEQAELERAPLEEVAPTEGDLSRQRLSNIASILSGPRGTRESGLSPEEIDRFARERGILGDRLARGLAAPTQFASTNMPPQSSGDPRLLDAIDAFEAQRAASLARPKDISEADWRNLQMQREEYSKLPGGTPFKPGDEETSPTTRLYRKDELKAPREELIAAGAQAVTNPLGQEEYWLPEGSEFTLAKAGPVDDTVEGAAEGGGFRQGRLAFANKRLSEQTAKTNTLRSAVRRLKKKSGDQLVNPWERFGKPATFMPSIRATSFAVQRAKDGDPSLISQMIGRQLYPSELRDLERLTSDYQDFAGGVRAKATEITKGRKTAAQEAADAEAMGIANKYASLATGLVAGSKMGGMSQEDMDTFSDTIGAIATKDPKAAMEIAQLYTQMNNKERELSIRASKNRGTGPGGLGDKTVLTEHRNWTKILASVEDDVRAAYTKQNEKLFGHLVQDNKGVYRLKKDAPDNMKKAYRDAQAGIKALLQQHARARTMVSKYDRLMGLTAPVATGSDVKGGVVTGSGAKSGTPAQFSKAIGLLRSSVGDDGENLFDSIATASEEDLAAHKESLLAQRRRGDGSLVFGGNEAFVDELIKRARSQGAARGGEPTPPPRIRKIATSPEEERAKQAELIRQAGTREQGRMDVARDAAMDLVRRINDGETVVPADIKSVVKGLKEYPSRWVNSDGAQEDSAVLVRQLEDYARGLHTAFSGVGTGSVRGL